MMGRLLQHLVWTILLWVVTTATASAACDDLRSITLSDVGQSSVYDLQNGARIALQLKPDGTVLEDGRLGEVTQGALASLCEAVPRLEGQSDVVSTQALALEYAEIQKSMRFNPGSVFWADTLYGIDLKDEGKDFSTFALRVATTPQTTAFAIEEHPSEFNCAQFAAALALDKNAEDAVTELERVLNAQSAIEICSRMSLPSDPRTVGEALSRLGEINARRAGGLRVLASPDFLDWIDQDKVPRLRRLAGSVPAVIRLIDDFNAQNPAVPGATNYTGGDCSPNFAETSNSYYALGEAELAEIKTLISVTAMLQGFKDENPTFDSANALWLALEPTLNDSLGDCILPGIERLVIGNDELPLEYAFKPGAAEALAALPPFAENVDVLADFAEHTDRSKPAFLANIKEKLTASITDAVVADIEGVAETVAAGSEPVEPALDTALIEIPEDAQLGNPAPGDVSVTAATDDALQSVTDDQEITDAILATPFEPASTPELIKSQARNALSDLRRQRISAAVEEQIQLIEPQIAANWTITQPLSDAITAIPYVDAAMRDPTGKDIESILQPLMGVEYPSLRLFKAALDTVAVDDDGTTVFSTFIQEQIIRAAYKEVPNPRNLRNMSPIDQADCGCVADRIEGEQEIYGFYPYWFAPDPKSEDDVLKTVDFNLISQIAFYGLEFTYTGPAEEGQRGQVDLINRRHWDANKATFVNSAHRHRARADLAFDLRRWTEWDDTHIEQVVSEIIDQVAPHQRFEDPDPGAVMEDVATRFDPMQVDGITLIFHDYEGLVPETTPDPGPIVTKENVDKMVVIIKRLYESLPNRDRVKINVAFDFSPLLSEVDDTEFGFATDKPLFDELFGLMVKQRYVLSPPKERDSSGNQANTQTSDNDIEELSRVEVKVIDKLLLFLERPTTDTKKDLRSRMEDGLFQGENRQIALRSILPIVPAAGHQFVRQNPKPNDPDRSIRPEFSQFYDDTVYFKDNFGGMGFWPVPHSSSPEILQITNVVEENFNQSRADSNLSADDLDKIVLRDPEPRGFCGLICPNRAFILMGAGIAVLGLGLLWRQSFYNGTVYWWAFKVFFKFTGLLVPGLIIVLGALLALWLCDPQPDARIWLSGKTPAPWWFTPKWMFCGLLVGSILAQIYASYIRVRNGPHP